MIRLTIVGVLLVSLGSWVTLAVVDTATAQAVGLLYAMVVSTVCLLLNWSHG